MRKYFTAAFLLWWFATVPLEAQERYKADSLLGVLKEATGTKRVEILKQLSRSFIGSDKEKSISYGQQCIDEATHLGNDSFIVISLNNMAAAYQNAGDKRSSLPYLERAVVIAQKNGNERQLLESLAFKATAYAGMKQMDKAVQFAQEGLKYAEKLRDSVGMLNGLEIIAAGYKDLKKNEEAIKIYQQEIALLDHLPKRLFEKGRVCVNLGLVYFEENRKQEAIAMFEKGKIYFEKFNYPVGALVASINLADAYLNAGEPQKAAPVYREILDLNQSIHDPELAAISHTGLGAIELEKKQFEAALAHFKQAELAAKPAALFEPLKELYNYMTDLYSLQGDYHTAKIYKQLAKDYTDSLLSADVRDRVVEYQTQYETAQKEKEIAEQQLKITAQEGEIFRKNTLNYGLLASLLAFLVLAYLFYNRYRLRKKAELDAAIISEQQLGLNAVIEAQESERKRIAKDLHDGIAQEMAAIRLGFSALQHKISSSSPAEAHQIGNLARQLDDSCAEVRSISHVMMPPTLEQQGLAPSLELLLRNTFQNSGLQYEFDCPRLPAHIDEKVKIGLYRIAQELLNNIIKHAKASKVVVLLYEAGNQLILQVEDDGQGFDFEQARAKGTMGLLNILSRVSALNGVFQTGPAQPKGTLSTIRIPVNS